MSDDRRIGVVTAAALIYLAGSLLPVLGSLQVALVCQLLSPDPRLHWHLLRAVKLQTLALAVVFGVQVLVVVAAIVAPAVVRGPFWFADLVACALALLASGLVGLFRLQAAGVDDALPRSTRRRAPGTSPG